MDATIYIAVDTLEYLKKGGTHHRRCSSARYNPQTKTHPDDPGRQTDSYAKARGMKSAFRVMLEALKSDIASRLSHLREKGLLKIGIANTMMDPDKLEIFKAELKKTFPDMELVYFPSHLSIGTHVGPEESESERSEADKFRFFGLTSIRREAGIANAHIFIRSQRNGT